MKLEVKRFCLESSGFLPENEKTTTFEFTVLCCSLLFLSSIFW